jgi:hypothetical protein
VATFRAALQGKTPCGLNDLGPGSAVLADSTPPTMLRGPGVCDPDERRDLDHIPGQPLASGVERRSSIRSGHVPAWAGHVEARRGAVPASARVFFLCSPGRPKTPIIEGRAARLGSSLPETGQLKPDPGLATPPPLSSFLRGPQMKGVRACLIRMATVDWFPPSAIFAAPRRSKKKASPIRLRWSRSTQMTTATNHPLVHRRRH